MTLGLPSLMLAAPEALILLLGVLALSALALLTLRWQRRVHRSLAGGSGPLLLRGAAGPRRRALKSALALCALTCLVLGAAGPEPAGHAAPSPPARSDVLIVLDVSLSMLSSDVSPSRFDLAGRSVEQLLNAAQRDCLGLIVFGGRAALRVPCTLDYEAVRAALRATTPGSAPSPGTSLADALRSGLAALRYSEAPARSILLISDGEDLEDDPEAALQDVKAAGVSVSALGVGTPEGGPIPLPGGLKQDREGRTVITKLNEAMLQRVAAETGGSYLLATQGAGELAQLYRQMHGLTPTASPAPEERPATLSRWLAFAALLLLLAEIAIAERQVRLERRTVIGGSAFATLALLALAPACAAALPDAFALNRQGLEAYGSGRFDEALDAFEHAGAARPDLPEPAFNAGTALYRGGDPESALQQWQHAAAAAGDPLHLDAEFNAGNALYQLGRYEDAAEAYRRVIRATADDLDARINLELALQKLASQQPDPDRPQPPPGTPRTQPLGDEDPGPQGDQPQPPLRPSQGREGPDPQDSTLPPRGGDSPLPPASAQPSAPPQPASPSPQPAPPPPPPSPAEALRQALAQAGEQYSREEALAILAALRLRDAGLQERYNQAQPTDTPAFARPGGPEKDW